MALSQSQVPSGEAIPNKSQVRGECEYDLQETYGVAGLAAWPSAEPLLLAPCALPTGPLLTVHH